MSQILAERISADACVLALSAGVHVQEELDAALEEAIQSGARRLVVDLTGIRYVDTPTLNSLLAALERLRAAGGGLSLVVSEWELARALEITRLDELFTIHETRGAALAG